MSESPQLQSPASDAIAEDDRRTHQRLPASKLGAMKAQLTTGPAVVLKDVSRSGARFQSESRLLPGLSVALKMVTPDGVVAVRGRVVRSRLVRMDSGGMGYEAAVSFTDLLPGLEEPAPAKNAAAPPAAPKAAPKVSSTAAAQVAPAGTPAMKSTPPSPATTAAPAAGTAPGPATPAPVAAPAAPVSPFAALADDAPPAARTAAAVSDGAPADEDADDDDLPMMMLVTASVSQTTAELHEMFNGNDW
jgi:hypothetical protein